MGVPRYPKVLAIGHRAIRQMWDGQVEATEKVDGSQFSFGIEQSGEVYCRTRRTDIVVDVPEKMFKPAVDYVKSIANRLDPLRVYFGEYLQKEKHNVLKYNRIPKNNIALFGVMNLTTMEFLPREEQEYWAEQLDIDIVPLLWIGVVVEGEHFDLIQTLLDQESFLGGPPIEGVVFKNYGHDGMIGDRYMPYLVGKYVSERFKEKASDKSYGNKERKLSIDEYIRSFRTEARWEKAIQHMREDGTLLGEPKDIGALIREIQNDLLEEEGDAIKARLWNEFKKQTLATVIKGFPEWYKEKLAKGEIDV